MKMKSKAIYGLAHKLIKYARKELTDQQSVTIAKKYYLINKERDIMEAIAAGYSHDMIAKAATAELLEMDIPKKVELNRGQEVITETIFMPYEIGKLYKKRVHTFEKNYKIKFIPNQSRKKIFIQANCQGAVIQEIFSALDRLKNRYEILQTDYVQTWKTEDEEYIFSKISDANIFLHQPILNKSFGGYTSANLLNRLKDKVEVISFPNLYFSGYHPQSISIKDRSNASLASD